MDENLMNVGGAGPGTETAPRTAHPGALAAAKPGSLETVADLVGVFFNAGKLLDVAGPLLELRGFYGVLTSGSVTLAKLTAALSTDAAVAQEEAAAFGKLLTVYMTVNADPSHGPQLRAVVANL